MEQNRKANRTANEGMDLQREQANREREIYELLLGKLGEADSSGAFDPERAIAQLDKDRAEFQGRDQSNLAGALRISGYRPGDSAIGDRMDAVGLKYQAERDRQATQIRRDLPMAKLQAYSSLRAPNLAGIGQNITSYGASQRQSLAPLVEGLQPYMMPRQQAQAPNFKAPSFLSNGNNWLRAFGR